MLLLQNSLGERVFVVFGQHGNRALRDDYAMIEVFIDEMNGAAADLNTVFERLPLRVETWKCRQQRRMNVQNPIWECRKEGGRDEPHVSGEADQIHLMLAQTSDDRSVMLAAAESFALDYVRIQAAIFCRFDAWNIRFVGDYDCNFRAGNLPCGDIVGDGEEVGAASGEQDSKALHE